MINTLSKINLSKIGQEGGRSTLIWIMSIYCFFAKLSQALTQPSWAEVQPYFLFFRPRPRPEQQRLGSPRKLNFSMRPQFNPTSPKMERKKITSQSPRIAVASYFVSFWLYLSHFKSDFDEKKQKIGLLNEYNITSHLASHQLVSQNCRGQLFLLLLTISQPFQVGF